MEERYTPPSEVEFDFCFGPDVGAQSASCCARNTAHFVLPFVANKAKELPDGTNWILYWRRKIFLARRQGLGELLAPKPRCSECSRPLATSVRLHRITLLVARVRWRKEKMGPLIVTICGRFFPAALVFVFRCRSRVNLQAAYIYSL